MLVARLTMFPHDGVGGSHAEPEEAQGGLEQDRLGDVVRRGDAQRSHDVRQQVAQDDGPVA